ncbi:MAG TPA: alpha-L-fucosidase [Terracidiphilus sp.]|nr:alpha-L-fucosidase [Terracidiphilus sp.]
MRSGLDRRTFLKAASAASIAVAMEGVTEKLNAETYRPNWESIDARPTPSWFTNDKFGIFIHWGVYSVPAYAPVIPGKLAYAEWYWHQMTEGRDNPKADPIEKGTWEFHKKWYGADYPYQNFAPQFRAELFDPDEWARIFANSGAKYIALTSKHHEGFALWPSKEASSGWARPWNAVDTGPRRDLLGDLTQAVRKKNLRMGYYYSLYEWYNPLWLTDRERFVREHMFPQFKDLVTRYQPSIIFSDGEWEMDSAEWHSTELLTWLFNESPVKNEVVINDRWGKDCRHQHGGYWTTEYTSGMKGINHPWEESRGMGVSYGLNRAERLDGYHTGRELILILVDTVSRGGNLLLDIGPAADGTIPIIMEERLTQIGDWLKTNGEAIYGTKPWKSSRQWSKGEIPQANYNGEFDNPYDISKLTAKPEPGKARVEAFITAKDGEVFAILPEWPDSTFQLRDIAGVKGARLIGYEPLLRIRNTDGGVVAQLPDLPENLRRQSAWTIKFML